MKPEAIGRRLKYSTIAVDRRSIEDLELSSKELLQLSKLQHKLHNEHLNNGSVILEDNWLHESLAGFEVIPDLRVGTKTLAEMTMETMNSKREYMKEEEKVECKFERGNEYQVNRVQRLLD